MAKPAEGSAAEEGMDALGLHTKQRFNSADGMSNGNENGNQIPAGNPTGPKPAK